LEDVINENVIINKALNLNTSRMVKKL